MTKLEQVKNLIEATKMICDSGVCPKSPRLFHYWWDMVKFCHKKGYLYLAFDEGKIDVVAIGYRIPKLNKAVGKVIPEKESGSILYVPVLVSKSKDNTKLMKLLSYYLSQNKVTQIAYRWRGDENDLRIRNLNHVRT